jgi:toxin ParE1/3/4
VSDYKLSANAKEDLKRIYIFEFEHFGEQQADVHYDAFFDAFERIASNPNAYPSVDNIRAGYRRCPCGSDSIYFRIRNNIVEVMAIIGGQDTDMWL